MHFLCFLVYIRNQKMINNILIVILNKILALNPSSVEYLKSYHNKCFYLNIVGLSLKAQINIDGLLINSENETDAIIIIPLEAASYLINNDKLDMLRQIKITGDLDFAVKFLEIISKLNFDGVYAKISPLNGVILHQLERVLLMIQEHFKLVSGNMGISISEYMQYETGEIINQHKLDNFCGSVDELKIRTDLLSKKIEKLVGDKL